MNINPNRNKNDALFPSEIDLKTQAGTWANNPNVTELAMNAYRTAGVPESAAIDAIAASQSKTKGELTPEHQRALDNARTWWYAKNAGGECE